MQAVFGTTLNYLARKTGCVQRQRKFSGMSLLRTLVLTVLYRPAAKDRDYCAMAARLGVYVTEQAIDPRFTDGLVQFLSEALKQAVSQTLDLYGWFYVVCWKAKGIFLHLIHGVAWPLSTTALSAVRACEPGSDQLMPFFF